MDNIRISEKMTKIRDRYDLPDSITIKIRTKGLDRDLLDALHCLFVPDKSELPFELARYVAWPSHQRAITARAQILLRNGFLDLIEKSVEKSPEDASRPEVKASRNDGFLTRPQIQI